MHHTQPNIQQSWHDHGCLQYNSYDVYVLHTQPWCIYTTHIMHMHHAHSRIFNKPDLMKGVFSMIHMMCLYDTCSHAVYVWLIWYIHMTHTAEYSTNSIWWRVFSTTLFSWASGTISQKSACYSNYKDKMTTTLTFWSTPGCLVLASNLPVCNLVVKFSTLWVCLPLPLNNVYV